MATPAESAQLSAANTNRDGSGTLVDLFTAGTFGAILAKVELVATGTTTAGVIRLFLYDGTNNRLYDEVLVSAITPSASVEVWSTTLILALTLKPGWKLKGATHNAETFNVVTHGVQL